MKIMVSGSRHFGKCTARQGPCGAALNHRYDMEAAFRVHVHPHAYGHGPVELWHGASQGADTLAAHYWHAHRLGPVRDIPANWQELGKRAGHVRNGLLVAQMPDMLIAFPWEGGSPGTWDAITQAREAGITTHVYRITYICPLIEATLR